MARRERRSPLLRSGVLRRHILDAQAATALGECWTQMFSAAMHCGGSIPYLERDEMEGNGIDGQRSCRHGEIWTNRPASIERFSVSHTPPPICSKKKTQKKNIECLPSWEALASSGRYFAFSFSLVDLAQVARISSPLQQFSVYPERKARNRRTSSHEGSA